MSRPSNSARVGPEADRGDAIPRSVGQGALRSQALSPLLTPYITPLTSRCSCRNPCVTSALCLRENNNSNTKTNSLADLFSISSRKDCRGRALSAASCDVARQTSGAGCVVRKLSEQTLHAAKQTPSTCVQNVHAVGKTWSGAESEFLFYFIFFTCLL